MTASLQVLLSELERFGEANDNATAERPRRMLNITRDTGELLSVLVQATSARCVLEIGTSNGYSTLWLASAARVTGGAVTTVELSDYTVGLARQNFSNATSHPEQMAPFVALVKSDADFTTSLVPVGNGEFLAVKAAG
jgi:predicted O-methyltransferase YrrM